MSPLRAFCFLPFKGHCEQKAMRDEGVTYVAGRPLLNLRCTSLPGCISTSEMTYKNYCVGWGVKLYSLNHPVPLTITRVISRTGAAGGAEVRRRVVVCCRPRTRRTSTRTGTERTAKRRCSERRRSGKTKRSSLHLSTCHQR